MMTCKACDAEVVFVASAKSGKAMILDAKPAKGVVLVDVDDEYGEYMLRHPDTERTPTPESTAARLQAAIGVRPLEPQAVVVDVYTDHHATCTDPDRFRR